MHGERRTGFALPDAIAADRVEVMYKPSDEEHPEVQMQQGGATPVPACLESALRQVERQVE